MNINDIKFIEEEVDRINAQVHESDMQAEIKSDIGKWAKATYGIWGIHRVNDVVDSYAEYRGWTQEGFDEMEVVF